MENREKVEPKIVVSESQEIGSSNPKVSEEVIERIIKDPTSFGREEQQVISSKVSLLETKIVKLASGEATKPVTDRLYELQRKLEELNPKYYEKQPLWKKILHLVPKGEEILKAISQKYTTVKEQVETIKMHLSDSLDVIIQDTVDLQTAYEEMSNYLKKIEERTEEGKAIIEELKRRLAQATDPATRKAIERALSVMSLKVQDLETLKQAVLQFLVSAQQTIENNQLLKSTIERTIETTSTILTIGLMIRASLANQKRAIEAVRETQNFASELLKDNAEALQRQTKEVEELYTSPVLAMDKLEQAYNTLLKSIQDYDQIRRKGIELATQNIQKLESMNKVLKRELEKLQ